EHFDLVLVFGVNRFAFDVTDLGEDIRGHWRPPAATRTILETAVSPNGAIRHFSALITATPSPAGCGLQALPSNPPSIPIPLTRLIEQRQPASSWSTEFGRAERGLIWPNESSAGGANRHLIRSQ